MLLGKHINKYYLKHSFVLLLGILALILVDYYQLKIPEIYRMVINGVNDGFVVLDGVTVDFNVDFLLSEVAYPLIITIIALVIGRFAWRIAFFGTAIKVETDLRKRMFSVSVNLSQEYYSTNKVGNLMSLYTNDLETVQECFGSGVLMLFDALLLGCMALYKMWDMNNILTLLSLIPMALLLLISTLVRRYMMDKWRIRQEAFSSLSDFSQESYSGIAVIKAFVKETKELWEFKRLNKNNENANVAHTRASTLLHIFVTLFVESVICIIIGYGGFLVYNEIFDAGQFVEFIGYFNTIIWPIMAISQLIEMQSRGKASLNRISELLDASVSVKDREDVLDISEIKGEICFKNLTFRYPGANYNTLENVSFEIKTGENVGIIGKTGAGKTTLVDLILRTYNVEDGTLFVDGIDVNRIPLKTLRHYCSYVPQDNFLFSDTIKNNIAFSSDTGAQLGVEESAKLAAVHDNIIGFNNKYDTVLGERGVTVSGGQKQRISIARALMKNSPILILDDSVSSVDTKTESEILVNLSSLRKGKTTILIAHRISTVEKMDKIIFIEEGKVLAIGTHEELYATSNEYRNMVQLQKLDEERGII